MSFFRHTSEWFARRAERYDRAKRRFLSAKRVLQKLKPRPKRARKVFKKTLDPKYRKAYRKKVYGV